MSAATTAVVELMFMDREERIRSTTLRYAFSLPVSSLISTLDSVIPVYQALSNGVIVGWKITYKYTVDDPGTAEIGSDARSNLALFYRDEERYESLLVPSPNPEIFENEGAYSGIRANSTLTQMVPWVDPASPILARLKTPEGLSFPTLFLVGGLEL